MGSTPLLQLTDNGTLAIKNLPPFRIVTHSKGERGEANAKDKWIDEMGLLLI